MFEEIKFRYKALKISVRMLIVSLVGILPGACNYFDASPQLEADVEAARQKEASERQKLANAKGQIKNLPAMEEKLAFTNDQLKKAENLLPSVVQVDEVVELIGRAAVENDVQVKFFAPVGEKTIQGEYPYDEVRFKVTMSGQYPRLGKWLDSVAGVDSKAYLKNWEIGREVPRAIGTFSQFTPEPSNSSDPSQPLTAKPSKRELAIKFREDFRVELKSEIVFYRVASALPKAVEPDPKNPAGIPADQGPAAGPAGAGQTGAPSAANKPPQSPVAGGAG